MTAEEGEKNLPRDEEPFLDDEKNGRLCTLCLRLGGGIHSLRCYGLRCGVLVDYMFMPPSTWIT